MPKINNLITALILIVCAACENPYHPDSGGDGGTGTTPGDGKSNKNLTLRVSDFEQTTFNENENDGESGQPTEKRHGLSRSGVSAKEMCSLLSFAVYSNADGSYKKVGEVSQDCGDNSFGTAELSVDKGSYLLVVIGHNGTGKATMTNPEKITFPNNKTTDTFFCSHNFTISDDKAATIDLCLKRAVAKVVFSPEDKTPDKVAKMQFYYTGGSSTFDAISGKGCVNSKQTEERNVEPEAHDGSSSYDIYTFPRDNSNAINLQVTAFESSGTALFKRQFNNIPVTSNFITRCHGKFFGDDASGGRVAPGVSIDGQWSSEHDYQFEDPSSEFETE